MELRWRRRLAGVLVALALLVSFSSVAGASELVLMATTDIHANIYPWDYYGNRPDESVGLAKIYTLVKQIRAEHPNTLLVDDGDLIQGSPLASYLVNVKPPDLGEVHPIIDVLNRMGFDAAAIGNHEFNFGLPYAENVFAGAAFPILSANVYEPGTREPHFTPYVILERSLDGKPIKIGLIGFTPPQIMVWDRGNLTGKVEAGSIVDAARRFVPDMKAQGADLIVALAHTGAYPGASTAPGALAENAAFALAQTVPGIDVIVVGHSHQEIPGKGLPDHPDGQVNGVQLVQPSFWGKALGVVTLDLEAGSDGWRVTAKKAELLPVKEVQPAPEVVAWARPVHEATVAYVTSPIGETLVPISSRASQLTDTAVIQLINDVQRQYVQEHLKGTEYERLPVLSAAAPFKSGYGGETDFTDIPSGGVTIGDVASMYIYDNTLKAIKVTGADLKAWLEHASRKFNQISPGHGDQPLFTSWPGYNFDQIDGIGYRIDATQPEGQRIVDLTFQGRPVAPDQAFVLATNNYRADGGGGFPATGEKAQVVFDPQIASRQLIVEAISRAGTINPTPDHNWSLVPNYLDHPQAAYVYPLVDRGIYVGDLQGRLALDAPLTRGVWAGMVKRGLGLDLAVDQPGAPVTAADAARDLGGYVGDELLAGDADQTLTQADAAQLLAGILAAQSVLVGR
ncbi:bifunctional 2',3'-cyclic-nucleotide 2'-phosphodiesterase/3'-nucleotidase [Limnochorda pilosa]|uniref:2', 3'-cyclic nucleotide 2'-phosphodiesterase n=1 Tax=Limnochorda pilosa TaxID=1555112 RepID=A0A0K2SL90_LIMPI|nr:bifunctional 2',3'-cyclic-nucleotide 2'-phosphodiesterase/3'-nucleotidase [Limnochorda pilosa]BAS27883.1 2', 3'-cyclic nucleotide 2'-phosphodiesterase [Limnochorda pilosa]